LLMPSATSSGSSSLTQPTKDLVANDKPQHTTKAHLDDKDWCASENGVYRAADVGCAASTPEG
jgi:hypothetical protein